MQCIIFMLSGVMRFGFSRLILLIGSALFAFQAHADVYSFAGLYRDLGYSDSLFGATDDELLSLRTYTDTSDTFYAEINSFLRFYPKPYPWYGIGPEQARELVAGLDRIIDRAPVLPHDLILFRGLSLSWRPNLQPGEEFEDRAYVSTSTARQVAERFARKADHSKVLFVLYFGNESQKGILIDEYGEDEVLLPRGQRFRAMDRRQADGYTAYLVQLCGRQRCATKVTRPDVIHLWGR